MSDPAGATNGVVINHADASAFVAKALSQLPPMPGQPVTAPIAAPSPEGASPPVEQPPVFTPPPVIPAVAAPSEAQTPPPAEPPAAAPAAPTKPDPAALANRFRQQPQSPDVKIPESAPMPAELTVDENGKPDQKAQHAFAQLRNENTKFRRDVVPALEKRATDAEASVKDITAERDTLKRELEDANERIGKLSISESPVFKQKYASREAVVRNKFVQALQTFASISPDEASAYADQLLSLAKDPKALAAQTSELHPSVTGAAMFAAQELAAIDAERSAEVDNWRQTAAAQQVDGARREAAQSVDERRALAASAVELSRGNGNPAFAAGEDGMADAFIGFTQTASQSDLISMAADGFAMPVILQSLAEQTQRAEEAEQRLAAYKSARAIPVSPFSPPPPAPPPPAKMDNVLPAGDGLHDLAMRFARNVTAAAAVTPPNQ